MQRTPKPFTAMALPQPCPACGGEVRLGQSQERIQARCQSAGCRFGFDADKRGRGAAACPACGEGWLKTTPKGRVCAHCGKWDNAPGGGRNQGSCPKCKTGLLSVIKGEYGFFVGCSDLVCGLTYTCDEDGRPEGGHCRLCKGPVRKTRTGGRICLVCETWLTPKPPGWAEAKASRPAPAPCAQCGQPLRAVWIRKGRWLCRCDACALWVETAGGQEAPA